ncbi:MAG: RraA family protein [Candidatus Latescibacteria bacterium]|nr:RraA family protein [Candidatus Latescibacterota bacterium]
MDGQDDQELFDRMTRELYSAVIADALDSAGARTQILRHDIRPLYPEAIVVGRAFTVLSVDVYTIPEEPYKMELEAVDRLKPGDVLVATTNGSTRSSLWGELLSTAARARGARGAVIDGLTRDTLGIIRMRFPVFVRGIASYDSKGRSDVIAYGVPIQCGDVLVNPGDIIFGDHDGLVVIPQAIEREVIEAALEKARGENTVKQALENGMLATDAFAKYGIL